MTRKEKVLWTIVLALASLLFGDKIVIFLI